MGTTKIKNKKKISGGSLAAIIVSVLILLGLILSIVASQGVFMRLKKGASSDNFKVNGSMMEYYFNSYYSNWYSQYYYYIAYGLINFDPSVSLKEQYVYGSDTMTYYDYFKSAVSNQVTTMLKYCEAAKADENIDFAELEKQADKTVDATIDALKQTAKEQNVSLSHLIAQNYGGNVSKSDLKKAIKLVSIASEYSSIIDERFYDSVTDDEIVEYFSAHLSEFITAKYLTYSISSSWAVPTINADDYEGGEDSQEYKDALAKALEETKAKNEEQKLKDREFLDKMAAVKDAEEFKKLILDHEYDSAFSNAYETAVKSFADADKPSDEVLNAFKEEIKDKVIEAALKGETTIDLGHEHEDDEELSKWEETSHTLPKSVISKLSTALSDAEGSASYALKEDLDKFLFGGVKAKYGIEYDEDEDKDGTSAAAGDSKIIDEIKKEEISSYTLTIYYVTDEASRSEEVLRDVGHLLIMNSKHNTEGEDDAETIAKRYYEQLLEKATADGELKIVSKEDFEAFATGKTEDSNVFYEDVAKGEMVEEFEDWLFSAEKEGQIGLVETSDYGWHIMYYGGENKDGKTGWQKAAHESKSTAKTEDWYSNLPYEITINDSVFDALMD